MAVLPGKKAAAWLAPPILLGAALLGIRIVLGQPVGVFGKVLAILFALPLGWVVVSVLWPARAERTCPTCGREAVVRMDHETTHGLICRACGWRDETASSWLLAEEEGPLEDMVLRQRGRRPPGGANRAALVDSPPGAD